MSAFGLTDENIVKYFAFNIKIGYLVSKSNIVEVIYLFERFSI